MGCMSSSPESEQGRNLESAFAKRKRGGVDNAAWVVESNSLGIGKVADFQDELRQVSRLPQQQRNASSDDKISESLANVLSANGIINREASATLGQIRNASFYGGQPGKELMVLEDDTTDPPTKIPLFKKIGAGGFGQIFLGQYKGQRVAVKSVSGEKHMLNIPQTLMEADEEDEEDAADMAEFEQEQRDEQMAQLEAVLMSLMQHENIVTTHKILSSFHLSGQEDAGLGRAASTVSYSWFIIMELCTVGSLTTALNSCKFHQPSDIRSNTKGVTILEWDAWAAIETLKEVVKALMYLHANEIIHGDLKAGNVLLTSANNDRRRFIAKVTDFGLSRILKSAKEVTTKSFGTVTHMPPELLAKGTLTTACDVFSMGMLMWEIYMAKAVHKALRDNEVIIKVVNEGLRPEFPPDVPPEYKSLAEWCWHEEYKRRPTLAECLKALQHVQDVLCPQGVDSEPLLVSGMLPKGARVGSTTGPSGSASQPSTPMKSDSPTSQQDSKVGNTMSQPSGTANVLSPKSRLANEGASIAAASAPAAVAASAVASTAAAVEKAPEKAPEQPPMLIKCYSRARGGPSPVLHVNTSSSSVGELNSGEGNAMARGSKENTREPYMPPLAIEESTAEGRDTLGEVDEKVKVKPAAVAHLERSLSKSSSIGRAHEPLILGTVEKASPNATFLNRAMSLSRADRGENSLTRVLNKSSSENSRPSGDHGGGGNANSEAALRAAGAVGEGLAREEAQLAGSVLAGSISKWSSRHNPNATTICPSPLSPTCPLVKPTLTSPKTHGTHIPTPPGATSPTTTALTAAATINAAAQSATHIPAPPEATSPTAAVTATALTAAATINAAAESATHIPAPPEASSPTSAVTAAALTAASKIDAASDDAVTNNSTYIPTPLEATSPTAAVTAATTGLTAAAPSNAAVQSAALTTKATAATRVPTPPTAPLVLSPQRGSHGLAGSRIPTSSRAAAATAAAAANTTTAAAATAAVVSNQHTSADPLQPVSPVALAHAAVASPTSLAPQAAPAPLSTSRAIHNASSPSPTTRPHEEGTQIVSMSHMEGGIPSITAGEMTSITKGEMTIITKGEMTSVSEVEKGSNVEEYMGWGKCVDRSANDETALRPSSEAPPNKATQPADKKVASPLLVPASATAPSQRHLAPSVRSSRNSRSSRASRNSCAPSAFRSALEAAVESEALRTSIDGAPPAVSSRLLTAVDNKVPREGFSLGDDEERPTYAARSSRQKDLFSLVKTATPGGVASGEERDSQRTSRDSSRFGKVQASTAATTSIPFNEFLGQVGSKLRATSEVHQAEKLGLTRGSSMSVPEVSEYEYGEESLPPMTFDASGTVYYGERNSRSYLEDGPTGSNGIGRGMDWEPERRAFRNPLFSEGQ